MRCILCDDTGMFMFRRPMTVGLGAIRWVDVPQICMRCEAGDAAAKKYEQNLSDGKAGMAGLADSSNAGSETKT